MSNSRNAGAAAGGGAIYGLGIFGALVYFWQQADRFWEYLLAVVQGLFWPAFMVYEGLQGPRPQRVRTERCTGPRGFVVSSSSLGWPSVT